MVEWHLAPASFDVELVVSELVTNGVVHGAAPLSLAIEVRHQSMHIDVSDGGQGDPVARGFSSDAGDGRGLALVKRIATSWGVESSSTGKTVWADIETENSA